MRQPIEIGDITIIERSEKLHGHEHLTAYEIFIIGTTIKHTVYTNDIRLAVLAALELNTYGFNSQFAIFAAKMLEIDGEIWN